MRRGQRRRSAPTGRSSRAAHFGSNTTYGDVLAARATVEAATGDRHLLDLVLHQNAARLFGLQTT